jgi:uncharacterized protein HemX
MLEPSVIMALLSFVFALGAMVFGTWTLRSAADQYESFAKSHIGNLRSEMSVQGKELVQMLNRLAKKVDDEQNAAATARPGYDHLQNEVADLRNQVALLRNDIMALTAPRKKRV